MLSWISKIIKGIVIALGFILPGISGGVLAAILGIYERMIRFLAHPFKNLKEDILFFLPVAIGMLLGIGLFSYPIEYLLEHYQVYVLWSFAGRSLRSGSYQSVGLCLYDIREFGNLATIDGIVSAARENEYAIKMIEKGYGWTTFYDSGRKRT